MTTPHDLRAQIQALTRLAGRELDLFIGEVSGFANRDVALRHALPLLINSYGEAAAAISADWYDNYRAQLNVPASFFAAPARTPEDNGALQLINWARSQAQTPDTMIDLIYGGMQRRVANQARLTIMGAANQDRYSTGWRRIGTGHNCEFCDMLISRGAVYKESTVSFASHDNCDCMAAPAFGRWSDAFEVDEFSPSTRNRSDHTKDADAERARAWIADNLVG